MEILIIVLGALLVAVPAGIVTAVYVSEYAHADTRKKLKPILEVLSGMPTVVFGYFALNFIGSLLNELLTGVLVLAIMMLPIISNLVDDALRTLPKSLREAAYSLGATSFDVIMGILLPAAGIPILMAVLLAFSRAIGESVALILLTGTVPFSSLNFLETMHTQSAFVVLIVFLFALNLIAIQFRNLFQRYG